MKDIKEIQKYDDFENITGDTGFGVEFSGNLHNNNVSDELKNKHKVIIEQLDAMHYIVRIGKEKLHPFTKLHFIEWIKIQLKDETIFVKKFDLLEKPEFVLTTEIPIKKTLLSCNIDGIFEEEFD